jgi:hypothetical protein
MICKHHRFGVEPTRTSPATLPTSPTTRVRGGCTRAAEPKAAPPGLFAFVWGLACGLIREWKRDLRRALVDDCSGHRAGCGCWACTERPFFNQEKSGRNYVNSDSK